MWLISVVMHPFLTCVHFWHHKGRSWGGENLYTYIYIYIHMSIYIITVLEATQCSILSNLHDSSQVCPSLPSRSVAPALVPTRL